MLKSILTPKEKGERLKNRRKELNLTLQQIADMVGVTRQTISKWEHGKTNNIPRNLIELYAIALKVEPIFILGLEENINKKDKQETLIPEDLDTSILSVQQKADLEAILSMNLGLFMKEGLEITEYDKKQIRYSLTKLYLEKIKEMK